MILISADPGKSGGLAWDLGNGLAFCNMPENAHDLAALIRGIMREGPCELHLEEVGGYINGKMTGPAGFTFGRGFGELVGVAAALELPIKLCRPQKWQKALGLGTSKGLSKTEWKNRLKTRAQQLYPASKITLNVADAILIWHAAKERKL